MHLHAFMLLRVVVHYSAFKVFFLSFGLPHFGLVLRFIKEQNSSAIICFATVQFYRKYKICVLPFSVFA